MAPNQAFVFLLHSVTELEQSQFARFEQKLDRLTTAVDILSGRMALLLKALADEVEEVGTTLDGGPAGQERDTTQGLG